MSKFADNPVLAALAAELTPEAVQKSTLVLTDFNAGSLKKEDADRFINQVVDQSVLLRSIRVHRTDAPSGEISKLNIAGPVTQKATEAVCYTTTHKPSNSVVPYATKKTVSAIDISGEVQEDTIEGAGVKNTIMTAMVTQIGNDMENLAIEGDDSISGTTDIEMLLKTNDGFYVQTAAASGAAQVDAEGKAPSLELFQAMLLALPTRYRRDMSKLRWIMSSNTAMLAAGQFMGMGLGGQPSGSGLADQLKVSGGLPNILGIAPLVVPLLPEDLTIDGTSGETGTFIWLTDPQNFIYVVQRVLTVEWERVPRCDRDEGTVHMRTDFVVEEPLAVVRANNVNLAPGTARYGVA